MKTVFCFVANRSVFVPLYFKIKVYVKRQEKRGLYRNHRKR